MAFKMKAGKEGPFYKNFPDLNKDGDITQADVLMGRGVFKKYKSDAQRKAVHASKAESGLKKTIPFKKKGPCWKDHEMFGMKKKGGKMVPNCVPKKK
tara:strand:+ start:276 stop:566 length:291 start_codon:yes stop_codon:yes gene_type:complete